MRIVGGTHRGRRINAPKSLPIRPTTDFAKEGLFNVLHHQIELENINVLDLFGGSGNISYEFASRGAAIILTIDLNMQCINFINKTASAFDFKNIRTIKGDVFKLTNRLNDEFDIIFADPPYGLDKLTELPDLLLSNKLLRDDGLLIVEHPKEVQFNDHKNFRFMKTYGNVNFTFFQLKS